MRLNHLYMKIADLVPIKLSDLINQAVHQGNYPDLLKVAQVTPIHKSGSEFDFENNRLIYVLLLLNKVFERTLHSQLISFFYRFKITYEDHYGLLKKSTSDAIVKFTQQCYSYLNKK